MSNKSLVDMHYLNMKDAKSFLNFNLESSDSMILKFHLKVSNFFGKELFGSNKLLFHHFDVINS